ncbi:hypothetical protein F441_04493 [Phytophthora nicotianae CJ01A1]|uniref:Uncharacterized protein n=5 Tax=Phytophthora nicotianae TaxID=4792 RepID=V9FMM1_PHYNI|nr:hypothetical protein F443_04517 [Phytophthora nicotianae P1569]ETK92209.1 hypothetical protein L915_04389 [Phytophthora nicotianae]ETO81088.1 hypothetical protein F444_04544 [Phytophthora nicotianae P1976]ETP22139.1 hypothetical protein F441_04493 [Phytophthora nicotianae CJ01A1]ETP50030.1 hypothetical protein F442_04558 [Phytophthora nicotianae P10297]
MSLPTDFVEGGVDLYPTVCYFEIVPKGILLSIAVSSSAWDKLSWTRQPTALPLVMSGA